MSLHYPRVSRIHAHLPTVTTAVALRIGGRSRREPPPRHAEAGVVVVVDPERRTASVSGRSLSLTFMEFELLAHLVANPLRVYTRRQLLAAVWDQPGFGDTRTVDVHVARLRRKLGPEHRDTISTVRQVGYRFDPSAPPAAHLKQPAEVRDGNAA
ncbi:winged helix-turn-helix domain-containing protein [Kitasatospora sp. GP82]|uniref:winged helix-turn-helix domain-containing protein n=1 Tax=Kitasatospora sp. GP82 TaxID=3035089 RepID=UPI0024737F61|nr:winged helix-turn-helix domain-containing protein [Kitasatospora sp. GP82]MDH6126529.1 DNA-binding response OmpR family regulator [Kitasatospora sp. GP82]